MLAYALLTFDLKIVSRVGVDTGFWRKPDSNPRGRNYYLVVEAVSPDGRVINLPIRNEETGATESVSYWGELVDESELNRVKKEKKSTGHVRNNLFAKKPKGSLEAIYQMGPKRNGADQESGRVTKW